MVAQQPAIPSGKDRFTDRVGIVSASCPMTAGGLESARLMAWNGPKTARPLPIEQRREAEFVFDSQRADRISFEACPKLDSRGNY